jgi:hypothetical protein
MNRIFGCFSATAEKQIIGKNSSAVFFQTLEKTFPTTEKNGFRLSNP